MLPPLVRPLVPLPVGGGSDQERENAGTTVHVLEHSGSVREQCGIRLLDLARSLWPGGSHKSYFRLLKNVADTTQREFILKIEKRAIIVHSDMMHALIEPTRAVLFGADANLARFASLLDEMVECIHSRSQSEERAFERTVVESIVCAHVTMQTVRFKVLKPVALDILSGARRDNSHDAIMELYPVQVALSSFIERLGPVVRCLQPSLDSWNLAPAQPSQSFAADEGLFEEVLETWHNNAKEVLDDAMELVSNLADTMSFIEASLDCYRNRLIRLDYTVMVPTMSLTFGNLVAAVFGMNLSGGGQDPDSTGFLGAPFWLIGGYFDWAVIILFAVSMALCAVMLRAVHRSRNFYKANSTKFGNNHFFGNVGNDNYVLSLACSGPQQFSTRCTAGLDQIRPEVLADLARPALSVGSTSRRHS